MDINYDEIGKRIAHRRKELGLKQSEIEKKADLSQFLVGTLQTNDAEWKNVSEQLRNMNSRQLSLASSFLTWLSEQKL